MEQVERVAAYIDGLNLYYGMRAAHGHKYAWLDLEAMCKSLLKPHQQLVRVKYFTARVTDDPGASARQNTYLDALTSTSVEAIYGRIQLNKVKCKKCGKRFQKPEEKGTDVAISAHAVDDAHRGIYDAALLVSGDSDMAPIVSAVMAVPGRRVIAAFPPQRKSEELRGLAGASTNVSENVLRTSQLPNPVTVTSGVKLQRPTSWY